MHAVRGWAFGGTLIRGCGELTPLPGELPAREALARLGREARRLPCSTDPVPCRVVLSEMGTAEAILWYAEQMGRK